MLKTSARLSRRQVAIEFLEMVARGDIQAAYDEHVALGFHHHSPMFRGDAESLLRGMEESHAKHPQMTVQVLRAIAERDLVCVHSRVNKNPQDQGAVMVHIFRFAGHRIVELWDVAQRVPENAKNQFGMF